MSKPQTRTNTVTSIGMLNKPNKIIAIPAVPPLTISKGTKKNTLLKAMNTEPIVTTTHVLMFFMDM
jgi:hypothetical protein